MQKLELVGSFFLAARGQIGGVLRLFLGKSVSGSMIIRDDESVEILGPCDAVVLFDDCLGVHPEAARFASTTGIDVLDVPILGAGRQVHADIYRISDLDRLEHYLSRLLMEFDPADYERYLSDVMTQVRSCMDEAEDEPAATAEQATNSDRQESSSVG